MRSDESQDQDWHEHEAEKRGDNEEKDNEKRILSMAKGGSASPFLLISGALRSLIGGAASVMKAVNDSKTARRQLEVATSRSRDGTGPRTVSRSTQILGLYLSPYKRRQGVVAKKNKTPKRLEEIKMPSGTTTNV